MVCEYFTEGWQKVKPCWNAGWILDIFRVLFWILSKLSILNIIGFYAEKLEARSKKRYLIVDWYIFVFATAELIIFLIFAFNPAAYPSCNALKIFILV